MLIQSTVLNKLFILLHTAISIQHFKLIFQVLNLTMNNVFFQCLSVVLDVLTERDIYQIINFN